MIPHLIDQATTIGGNLDDDQTFRRFWEYVINASPDVNAFDPEGHVHIPSDWRAYPRNLAAILDTMFLQLAAANNKSRWCEKSPNNTEHMLAIADLFPNARFVHIIRDGRDCAASTHRRQHRTPALTIYRWRQIVSNAILHGQTLGPRYMQLRYEDLTSDPSFWMRKVCDHVELEFDPRVLLSSMPQSAKSKQGTRATTGRIEPNSEKWRTYFSARQIGRLEAISGKLLASLGYSVDNNAGNRDPAWLYLNSRRAIDYVKANRRLRAKLSGSDEYTWAEIYDHFIASLREYRAKRF